MDNKVNSSSVDSILEELKARGGPAPEVKERSIDEILAELGAGPKPAAPKAPPAPAQPANGEDTGAFERAEPAGPAPAPPQAEQVPAPAPRRQGPPPPQQDPWAAEQGDIELFGSAFDTGTRPRMGKAAALDKVDPDKFAKDAELASWFEGDGDLFTSKKDQKRAEKEQRKRLAEQYKEEKRQARLERRGLADEDVEEDAPAPARGGLDDTGRLEDARELVFGGRGRMEETGEIGLEKVSPEVLERAFFEVEEEEKYKEADEDLNQFVPETSEPVVLETTRFRLPDELPGDLGANPLPKDSFVVEQNVHISDTGELLVDEDIRFAANAARDERPQRPAGDTAELADEPSAPFMADVIKQAVEAAVPDPTRGPLAKAAREKRDTEELEETTQSFDLDETAPLSNTQRVPTAAFTHEFDTVGRPKVNPNDDRSLYLDDMVDDRFREFFSETVSMEREEIAQGVKNRRSRGKKRKSRSAVLTGEFAKLAEMAEADEAAELMGAEGYEDEIDDYNRPQDAPVIQGDIASLCTTLTRRTLFTGIIALLLLWMGSAFGGGLPLPGPLAFSANPILFSGIYLGLLLIAVALNFTTVATGLAGLFSAPTVDSAPAVAAFAGLLQAVMLLVHTLTKTVSMPKGTLFGVLCALLLCLNAFGKRVRAVSILRNFKLASAGMEHSAAYILDDSNELAYNITKGLEENMPTLLVSRPTGLVKGFLRQSFSQRGTDRTGRIIGWLVLGMALAASGLAVLLGVRDVFAVVSVFAAVACIAAPLSSSLVSGIPSLILQRTTARVGAVVPGWSAIEDLGDVNVVMATARDIFPPTAVSLKGIKTFEKERVDLAILYAASVLIEGCDTLRDIFLGVIQGKSDMLYKVESLTKEPGRGFTAWVQNNRVVIGSREMLQKHDIDPPPIETEMKYVPTGHMPVYLAVSGKLFAMFIVGYGADEEVGETLEGLIKSGVSLLVTSDDMNVTAELIEHAYDLPPGVVKVLGRRELDILEPLTSYIPESEGVMTHIGSFASFIGGMRAAAGCAASEKMSSIVQVASVALACLLCLMLAFSGELATLSIAIVLLYQLAWTLLVGILPFLRRY